jgi:hypothetical protein
MSTHPHRFGFGNFDLEARDCAHSYTGGVVDIPFPRSVRDRLLADGLAEQQRWARNSDSITFRVRSHEDVEHAVWLKRLSYLRYALKAASDRTGLDEQADDLRLNPQ